MNEIEVTLDLSDNTLMEIDKVAKLAGLSREDMIRAILALEVYKQGVRSA